MVMWKLKSCPRCGGDLLIDKDLIDGWYEQCLQCSFCRGFYPNSPVKTPGLDTSGVEHSTQ